MNAKWMRWGGLALATAVGLFWMWFGIASGVGEGLTPLGVVQHALVPGGVIALIVVAAWRWPLAGGPLLIAAGIAAGFFFGWWARFPAATRLFMVLTLVAPPVVAGGLVIAARLRSHGAQRPAA